MCGDGHHYGHNLVVISLTLTSMSGFPLGRPDQPFRRVDPHALAHNEAALGQRFISLTMPLTTNLEA